MTTIKGCSGPGAGRKSCGRAIRASGLCAGHYEQKRRGQELHPVRLEGGVRLPGMRVSKLCAAALGRAAAAVGGSTYDLAREVLERWARRQP